MAKKKLSYEEAVQRIEEIVEVLENEEVSLDNSMKLYKEGIELSYLCQEKLNAAEQEITILQKDGFGNLTETIFDIGEE